jgi:predicted sulfurtransferase
MHFQFKKIIRKFKVGMSCCHACEKGNFSRCADCGTIGCQRFVVCYQTNGKLYCSKCYNGQAKTEQLRYYKQRNNYLKRRLKENKISYDHSEDSSSDDCEALQQDCNEALQQDCKTQ